MKIGHERYCRSSNLEMKRHMDTEAAVCKFIDSYGGTFVREKWVKGEAPKGGKYRSHSWSKNSVRMDIVASLQNDPHLYYIDINIRELTCVTNVPYAKQHKFLEVMEKEKFDDYNEWLKNEPEVKEHKVEFIPFCVTSLGEFGPKALEFIHKVKKTAEAFDVDAEDEDGPDTDLEISYYGKTSYLFGQIGKIIATSNFSAAKKYCKKLNKGNPNNKKQSGNDVVRRVKA